MRALARDRTRPASRAIQGTPFAMELGLAASTESWARSAPVPALEAERFAYFARR